MKEYDCFRLKRAIQGQAIPLGAKGVVLMVYEGPPRAYEVEFPDHAGGNRGTEVTFTLTDDFMDAIAEETKRGD